MEHPVEQPRVVFHRGIQGQIELGAPAGGGTVGAVSPHPFSSSTPGVAEGRQGSKHNTGDQGENWPSTKLIELRLRTVLLTLTPSGRQESFEQEEGLNGVVTSLYGVYGRWNCLTRTDTFTSQSELM